MIYTRARILKRLTVSSKTGNTFGVLRSSFSLWGMSFIIEDGNGMPVFRVKQIGKFSFSEISFEILTMQDIFVGKLTQYIDCCACSPKSYKLDLVAPFDASTSLIFLTTVFFLVIQSLGIVNKYLRFRDSN
ncbi:hypothetical protein Avbf_18247 [Armadillidium vulgare]|nr:hypothetical protein Avbf_18247 [Armadillidium vulgare]